MPISAGSKLKDPYFCLSGPAALHALAEEKRAAAAKSSNPFVTKLILIVYCSINMMSLASMVEPMGLRP